MPKKAVSSEDKINILEEQIAKLTAMMEAKPEPKKEEEPKKHEPKEVTYYKFKFNNLGDPGQNLQFNYNTKYYELLDGCEVTLNKNIVEHLNGIQRRVSTNICKEQGVKEYTYKNRFLCQILSEETKVE